MSFNVTREFWETPAASDADTLFDGVVPLTPEEFEDISMPRLGDLPAYDHAFDQIVWD